PAPARLGPQVERGPRAGEASAAPVRALDGRAEALAALAAVRLVDHELRRAHLVQRVEAPAVTAQRPRTLVQQRQLQVVVARQAVAEEALGPPAEGREREVP